MDGIGKVGILAGLDSFENAYGMILCKLVLRLDLGLSVLFPNRQHLEECSSSEERVGRVSRRCICRHLPLALRECLQGKLFAVCGGGHLVQQRVLVWVVGLGLLKLLHQIGGIGGAFCVGRVEVRADDFLDDVEAHCVRSAFAHMIICATHLHQ